MRDLESGRPWFISCLRNLFLTLHPQKHYTKYIINEHIKITLVLKNIENTVFISINNMIGYWLNIYSSQSGFCHQKDTAVLPIATLFGLLWTVYVLSCISQTYKPCAWSASRLNKEPGVRDRDFNGLMNGESYTSEATSWSNIPPCAPDDGQKMEAVFAPRGKGEIASYSENYIRLALWLPGKLAEGYASHCPLVKKNHQLVSGASM